MKTKNKSSKPKSGIWEIDIVPETIFRAVGPDGKQFDVIIVVHQDSFFVLNIKIVDSNTSIKENIVAAFKEALSKGPITNPNTIMIKKKEYADFLREIADKHKISIELSKHLKAVPEVLKSIRQWSYNPEFNSLLKDKDDLYYDAMDAMNENDHSHAIDLLNEALKIDPHYVQTHVGLSSAYRETGNIPKYRIHTIKGYEETCKIFKKWPRTLSWHDIDNRKFHRAIFFRAGLYIEEGEKDKGLSLYRDLLKMWPNDNLGVRYYAAAIYAGKSIADIDNLWDECNEKQDWDRMENLLTEQNRKHNFWKPPRN